MKYFLHLVFISSLYAGIVTQKNVTDINHGGFNDTGPLHKGNFTEHHLQPTPHGGNSTGQQYKQPIKFYSRQHLMMLKDNCNKMKRMMKQNSGNGNSDNMQHQNLALCQSAENFNYKNLSAEEALSWIVQSQGNTETVYDIVNPGDGVSDQVLKTLMHNITATGMAMHHTYAPVISAFGDSFAKRKGGISHLSVEDLQFLGSGLVYTVPIYAYGQLSNAAFELILDLMVNESLKAVQMYAMEMQRQQNGDSEYQPGSDSYVQHTDNSSYQGHLNETGPPPGNEPMHGQYSQGPHDQYNQGLPPFDYAATPMYIALNDEARIKAICRRAFRSFSKLKTVDEKKRRAVLLFCAPTRVCKQLNNDMVQNNVDLISRSPWACSRNKHEHNQALQVLRLFPGNRVCGRYIANKLVTGGNNPFQLNSKENIMKLGELTLCLNDNYLINVADVVGCEMVMEAVEGGMLSNKVAKAAIGKCIQLPTDLSTLNCSTISSQYSPALAFLKMDFYKGISKSTLCDSQCLQTFDHVKAIPKFVKKFTMNKCFSKSNMVMNSATVQQLGAMVTELPLEKFDEISASDLQNNLQNIKDSMKSSNKQERKKKKAIMKQIAKKMRESGNIASVTDSAEIMKEVSLKDLKSSVSNLETDLGLNDPNKKVAFTQSQNRWIMKEIMKEKKADNFSVEDIRSKKSLVKGFLSSDIKSMGASQSSKNESGGIDLAKAMCEQTDWALKPLKAINRDLIVKGLQARNATHPMESLTQIDVAAIGCECMMHFRANELKAMDPDVCSAVCQRIGYCNNFRCLNPRQRKNVLQACMYCKGIGEHTMTDTDIDELGPNLISQLSHSQLTNLVPSTVIMGKLQELKDMCMNQNFRKTIGDVLEQQIGRSSSDYDADTLQLLGSGIMLLSVSVQEQLNKTVIAELAKTMVNEIVPTEKSPIKLQRCCERWLSAADIASLQELRHNLRVTIKDAIIYKMQYARRKRQTVLWTCDNVRIIGEAFTTVTDAEINNMAEAEFIDCLPDMGTFTTWTDAQKTVLLNRAEAVLNVSVCDMDVTDTTSLGVISQAIPVSSLSCLPLNESDIVASLGTLSGWSQIELDTLAATFLTANSYADLSTITGTDISVLGSLLCGFTTVQIATIPATLVGTNGGQIGGLSDCGVSVLTAFKDLAVHVDAYGPVNTWSAAEVGELKYIIAGLSGSEIQSVTVEALEGLSPDVIPVIPSTVIKLMTAEQMGAFTDVQAVSVTDSQKLEMSDDQKTLLGETSTGGQEEVPELTSEQPSTGCTLESTLGWLTALVIMLILLS